MGQKQTSQPQFDDNQQQSNKKEQGQQQQMNIQQQQYQQYDQQLDEQQYQQQYVKQNYQQNMRSHYNSSSSLSLLKFDGQTEDLKMKLIGVIVTICDLSSYDALFSSIPQQPDEGTRVRVYSTCSSYLPTIINGLKAPSQDDIPKNSGDLDVLKELIADIKSLEADNVVFNWECCSGCSSETFQFPNQTEYFEMIRFLVNKGFFLMFSDFSLKALIKQWDEKIMGPNPFVKISETSAEFFLHFDPKTLQDCDSSQLQKVGDLCQQGSCHVHAMGGTIMYTVDWQKAKTDSYSVQLLTVVTKTDQHKDPLSLCNENQICKIGEHKGSAGHVILSFPKGGGKILTSMGHWVELMKLDTTTSELLQLAERDYGKDYAQNMQKEMDCLQSESQKQEYRAQKAAYFVQSAMPQKNSYNMEKRKNKN